MLDSFERRFRDLHERSLDLIRATPDDRLFHKPRQLEWSLAMFSIGEYVLRSAGTVERTFGGISTRLWDDPFEWTLPERLATSEAVAEYLEEVERTRQRTFASFKSDDDLLKKIPAPERLRTIFDLMLETIARASHYQGRAYAILQMLSEKVLPKI